MKTILLPLFLVALLGCGGAGSDGKTSISVLDGNVAEPGLTYDLRQAFASALNCDPATLVWSIQESSLPGWVPTLDGSITQAGLLTAPSCGSKYVGATLNVQATCPATGRVGIAKVATAQEVLSTIALDVAILNPGTAQACRAATPAQVGAPIGSTVQFYARLNFTCGPVYVPALPDPLPPICP